jgi:predicted membrane protein
MVGIVLMAFFGYVLWPCGLLAVCSFLCSLRYYSGPWLLNKMGRYINMGIID